MGIRRVNGNASHHYNHNYIYSNGCSKKYKDDDQDDVDPLPLSDNGGGDHGYKIQKSQFLMSPSRFSPFSMASPAATGASQHDFIQHRVSRMDTLAGVAIKYGVEVADIKKLNGLVTDRQMFALKTLQIPLPGRHQPSCCLSNDHDTSRQQNPSGRVHSDLFDSFGSLRSNSSRQTVSPAMSSLQGYYGLKSDPTLDYRNGYSGYQEDVRYLRTSPASNTPLNHHPKSRSFVNGSEDENNGSTDNQLSDVLREDVLEKWNEKLIKRRQKSEADFTSINSGTPVSENTCGSSSSAITGKSLAQRSKGGSRTVLLMDAEIGDLTDSVKNGGLSSVRRSSSTSSLQDQESSSSIWPASKWSLKSDLQAFSAAAIAKPIFDGLPKPMTGRKNKAAID